MQIRNTKLTIIFLATACLGFFALAATAQAATYYVDANLSADCTAGNYSIANRACNGSNGNAYNTITDINSRLQAGDTAVIRAGTYTQQIAPSSSGTGESARIMYVNYLNESVLIDYAGTQADLNGKNYISIKGLRFNTSRISYLVDARYSSHCNVVDCYFDQCGAYNPFHAGYSSYLKVSNCTFADQQRGIPPDPGDRDTLKLADSNHALIENNSFGRVAHVTMGIARTTHLVIRNNTVSNVWHSGIGGNGLGPMLIENNVIEHSGSEFMDNPQPLSRDAREYQNGIQFGEGSGSFGIIFRRNVLYDCGRGFLLYGNDNATAGIQNNKIYQNVIDVSVPQEAGQQLVGIPINPYNNHPISNNIFKNNILYGGSTLNPLLEFWGGISTRDLNFWVNNNFYGAGENRYRNIYASASRIGDDFNGSWASEFEDNLNFNPAFANSASGDYNLQPVSPLIDAGAWLTTITSSAGNGTSFTVADAGYFCDGWGIVEGDLIQFQNQTQTARITAIDYATNRITVDRTVSWTNGLGVALQYSGAKPDIGAKEYGSAPPSTPSCGDGACNGTETCQTCPADCACPPSSGVIYEDSFTTLSGWTQNGGGVMEIQNGLYMLDNSDTTYSQLIKDAGTIPDEWTLEWTGSIIQNVGTQEGLNRLIGLHANDGTATFSIWFAEDGIWTMKNWTNSIIPNTAQHMDSQSHSWKASLKRGTGTTYPYLIDIYKDSQRIISNHNCGVAYDSTDGHFVIETRGTSADPAETRLTHLKLTAGAAAADTQAPGAPGGLSVR